MAKTRGYGINFKRLKGLDKKTLGDKVIETFKPYKPVDYRISKMPDTLIAKHNGNMKTARIEFIETKEQESRQARIDSGFYANNSEPFGVPDVIE